MGSINVDDGILNPIRNAIWVDNGILRHHNKDCEQSNQAGFKPDSIPIRPTKSVVVSNKKTLLGNQALIAFFIFVLMVKKTPEYSNKSSCSLPLQTQVRVLNH